MLLFLAEFPDQDLANYIFNGLTLGFELFIETILAQGRLLSLMGRLVGLMLDLSQPSGMQSTGIFK